MVTRALSSGLCATLATLTLATSVPAIASGPVPMLRLAPDDAPASVLSLDSKDAKAGKKLTAALRKAFANRGLSGGEEISLEEMRLTMGCTNDGVACLAEGGKTLGVRRLVFGYLAPAGNGYQLDIQILDVAAGTLEAQESIAVKKADLSDKNIDATATTIVNTLMPPKDADTDLPPRPDPLEIEPEPEVEPEPETPREPREKQFYFGREQPNAPTWKKIGLGVSLGLAVAAAGVAIGTGVWLKGPFRTQLLEAAEQSVADKDAQLAAGIPLRRILGEDEVTGQQIEPWVPPDLPTHINLCNYNTHHFDGTLEQGDIRLTTTPIRIRDQTGNVVDGARDAEVANICTDAENIRKANVGAFVALGVAGASTLVFTGLLLIHKRKTGKQTLLRRGLTFGVSPNLRQGGLSLTTGLRF